MTGYAPTLKTGDQNKAIIRNLPRRRQNDRMGFSTNEGIVIVRFSDILYCEAMGNYCRIHTRDEKSILISRTLKHVMTALPATEFIRIHQSYLVRFDEIISVQHEITLSNGFTLPVSRSLRPGVLHQLRQNLPII